MLSPATTNAETTLACPGAVVMPSRCVLYTHASSVVGPASSAGVVRVHLLSIRWRSWGRANAVASARLRQHRGSPKRVTLRARSRTRSARSGSFYRILEITRGRRTHTVGLDVTTEKSSAPADSSAEFSPLAGSLRSTPSLTASRSPASGRCKDVVYHANGAVYARTYELRARGTSCSTARKVALRWLRSAEGTATTPRPSGYRCRLRHEIVFTCTKGRATVQWYGSNRFGGERVAPRLEAG